VSEQSQRYSTDRPGRGAETSAEVEAELAAIFGEDELLRHPPDPFEEKILTGRNSFEDLRGALAADAGRPTAPPTRPTPRPRPTTSGTAASGTAGGTAAPADATPPPRPSRLSGTGTDTQSRIAELRRDFASRAAARAEADAAAATPSRFFHEDGASAATPPRTTTPAPRTTTPPPRPATPRTVTPPVETQPALPTITPRPAATRPVTTPRPATPAAPAAPEPPTRPASSDDRIAALRRDLEARPDTTPTPVRRPVTPPPVAVPEVPTPPPAVDLVAPAVVPETETRPVERRPRPPRPVVPPPEPVAPPEVPVAEPVVEPVAPEPAPVVDFAPPAPQRRPAERPAPAPAPAPAPVVRPVVPAGPAVATVEGVTKTIGKGAAAIEVLRGVDMEVVEGKLTVVLGPSGAGKSTLLHCLAGLDTPTAGRITVNNQVVSAMKERERTKYRRETVGFVFEEFNLISSLTVAGNIGLPAAIRRRRAEQGWYDQVVATMHVTDILARLPKDLTPEQRQRVAWARAFVGHPVLVVADEPTGDLNSTASARLLETIRDCTRELGVTIVLATHDADVAAYADRVYDLRDGAMVGEPRTAR